MLSLKNIVKDYGEGENKVAALKGVMATAPVHIGDVLLADVAGTGVDIIATKNVQ